MKFLQVVSNYMCVYLYMPPAEVVQLALVLIATRGVQQQHCVEEGLKAKSLPMYVYVYTVEVILIPLFRYA